MKDTEILIASFPSLENATKGINGYFYSTTITLEPDSKGRWALKDSTGKERASHIVKQKGKRFRFLCLP